MARITIAVRLDVDLADYRAEYGEDDLTAQEIRERIAHDIRDALGGGPYSYALRSVEAK